MRAITHVEVGRLLEDGGRWFTMSFRGRALPHPMQGVFSLNPSVFDLRFEGVIVFDMNDGLFRNDIASYIFRDTKSGEWRGWTRGFRSMGEAGGSQGKELFPLRYVQHTQPGLTMF